MPLPSRQTPPQTLLLKQFEPAPPGAEVVVVRERRRRYSAQEKIEFVKLTYTPGNSVSSIPRQYNISPSLLFKWRQLYKDGGLAAITSGSETASAKEIAQLKDEIKRLHQLVGRQAADLALYKEAMEVMREKKWIARQSFCSEVFTSVISAGFLVWRALI